jgi:hypothetical protein
VVAVASPAAGGSATAAPHPAFMLCPPAC